MPRNAAKILKQVNVEAEKGVYIIKRASSQTLNMATSMWCAPTSEDDIQMAVTQEEIFEDTN
jgi:hypothetical protein